MSEGEVMLFPDWIETNGVTSAKRIDHSTDSSDDGGAA